MIVVYIFFSGCIVKVACIIGNVLSETVRNQSALPMVLIKCRILFTSGQKSVFKFSIVYGFNYNYIWTSRMHTDSFYLFATCVNVLRHHDWCNTCTNSSTMLYTHVSAYSWNNAPENLTNSPTFPPHKPFDQRILLQSFPSLYIYLYIFYAMWWCAVKQRVCYSTRQPHRRRQKHQPPPSSSTMRIDTMREGHGRAKLNATR